VTHVKTIVKKHLHITWTASHCCLASVGNQSEIADYAPPWFTTKSKYPKKPIFKSNRHKYLYDSW